MKKDVAIKVQGVSKNFLLPHQRSGTIKSRVINPANWFKSKKYTEEQKALDNVSFEVNKGEFFGVVGRNGSGKSTLLKCLAGVYTPQKGDIAINGTLVPFIELGVGFNPELSGRDNIFLNGSLLGFDRKEMENLYDKIVEFSELEKSIDQKLKNYSSGMQVRLAFSIAIQAKGDILLLDEVLAVGDESFQKKCFDYFYMLKNRGTTVILVTHSMSAVRDFCSRALLLDSGAVVDVGSPSIISEKYSSLNAETTRKTVEVENKKSKKSTLRYGDDRATIVSVDTYDSKNNQTNIFKPNDEILIKLIIASNDVVTSPAVGLTISSANGVCVFAVNSIVADRKVPDLVVGDTLEAVIKVPNIFNDGSYQISCSITDITRKNVHSRVLSIHKFEVVGWEFKTPIVHTASTMNFNKNT